MNNVLPFLVLFGVIISQRVIELLIAKSNERWMKKNGAIEFGVKHYRYMVGMHILFFIVFFGEKVWLNRGLSPIWPLLLTVFIVTQLVRLWAITSLGKYWNTKILVLADAKVIRKGPYRFIKHPNYFVVAIELLVVPLLFSSYITSILFTMLNVMILSRRIPEEEKTLQDLTEYVDAFQDCNRFLPKIVK
ncbi:isoprenylcysteine carboxyl methyltransferase family protein [Neobacillus drentensis]|uniref:isoprenylcysteine carboxyl methyltransferase family protein n=1 Tax=Neobacillus drentensis TaxID=220684 RepID=UPI00300051AC